MQRAQEPESKGADPVRVFLILAAILVAIGAFFWLTRSDSTDTQANATTSSESPDFSLTDEEATAKLRELEEMNVQAYETRDVSSLPSVYAADSPLVSTVRQEIRTLLRKGVTPEVTFELRHMSVLSNTTNAVVIEERALSNVRFFDDQGREVTSSGRPEIQEIEVTLHRNVDEWLIFDSVITSAKRAD